MNLAKLTPHASGPRVEERIQAPMQIEDRAIEAGADPHVLGPVVRIGWNWYVRCSCGHLMMAMDRRWLPESCDAIDRREG